MRKSISIVLAAMFAVTGLLTAFANVSTPDLENFDYFEAIPWELPDDAEPMRVDKVHDGDSINLTEPDDDWYEQYRLIGIQAPELDGYRDEECYGPESAGFAQELVPVGSIVWIQQDISNTDPYGRYLRHVFIQDEDTGEYYLLSEVLIRGGYGQARSYPPDDLYDDVLREAQEYAQENNSGMWTCEEWEYLLDD